LEKNIRNQLKNSALLFHKAPQLYSLEKRKDYYNIIVFQEIKEKRVFRYIQEFPGRWI